MRFQQALHIADECQKGRGPDNPGDLAKAILRLIETENASGKLLGLLGHLYTLTARAASRHSFAYRQKP